eukprot:1234037-Amorphochlora_amoeboformis.AAC.1
MKLPSELLGPEQGPKSLRIKRFSLPETWKIIWIHRKLILGLLYGVREGEGRGDLTGLDIRDRRRRGVIIDYWDIGGTTKSAKKGLYDFDITTCGKLSSSPHVMADPPPPTPPFQTPKLEQKSRSTSDNSANGEKKGAPSADFECNICLSPAERPVVTLCGHLYW